MGSGFGSKVLSVQRFRGRCYCTILIKHAILNHSCQPTAVHDTQLLMLKSFHELQLQITLLLECRTIFTSTYTRNRVKRGTNLLSQLLWLCPCRDRVRKQVLKTIWKLTGSETEIGKQMKVWEHEALNTVYEQRNDERVAQSKDARSKQRAW